MKNWLDLLAFGLIFVVITSASMPLLLSGGKLNHNGDFFQYASRHESVRKSVLEYHTFPLRAYWFGGGFPTIGDPEDPTLNPLVVLSILFGSVMGLKLIGYLGVLVGGLATYALGRYVLGYTRWGALFAGLIFGTSLFVPIRLDGGNPNEVYAAFLPLCLLLVGFACRGHKRALLILPFVFYTMMSDGKLTCFMGMFYVGVICLMDVVPIFSTFTPDEPMRKFDIRPLKVCLLALGITFFVGMVRILPALEHINAKGGLSNMDLFFYPETYNPSGYKFERLWKEPLGWGGESDYMTLGWIPVLLFVISLFVFWRRAVPWGIALLLFGWLLMTDNAPIDLFKLVWHLPIFNAVRQPPKYFSFQIAFTIAIASGHCFWLLSRLRPKWLEHLVAILLIVGGLWFLYPKMAKIQGGIYDFDTPKEFLTREPEFFNVQGVELRRARREPFRAVTYLNLIRDVGTVDWYTGIPLPEHAIPKYFVDKSNNATLNPEYRGEAFFLEAGNRAAVTFRPNSILVEVDVQKPDVLVINQNYHRDWHTNRGECFEDKGLIAVRLDRTGSYTVRMRYVSRSFYSGLVLSGVSLAVLVFVCWAYRTGRLEGWTRHGSRFVRGGSRAVFWLIT